ncbi:MAG: glutamate--tRNA ligase [Rickettsiaceae bacterium]|jgi:glutamyl-tRNA synthetase|nr:glutamate--tRNA ligase [Rickettsiaceae bacterium]
MKVITRFAPSPTGYLHIGGARTALFNYLFARHYKGKFLLRIEDTDRARSTESAIEAIFQGLKWLNINWDDEVVFQFSKASRHAEIAHELVNKGKAYFCFTPQDEVNKLREEAIQKGEHFLFNSPWRDKDPKDHPKNVKPVVRLRAPREGHTIVNDLLQGKVAVENSHLDDMILLRSDGTPTYMLSVVVDDHDMNITHIIRGDDHLNNASRQMLIYQAMEWDIPHFVHIPLIHGQDGAKLSKRHGALGVEAYRDMGYLSEAINNYLLRLGWSHGNDEIISREQAIEWFNLESLGKSPARLDFDKMKNLNAHYIKEADNTKIASMVIELLEKDYKIDDQSKDFILKGMDGLKIRAKTLIELAEHARIYLKENPIKPEGEAIEILSNIDKALLKEVINLLDNIEDFTQENVQSELKAFAEQKSMKIGELMKPLRVLMTSQTQSPSVFEIMAILGKEISKERFGRGV